MTAAEPPMLEHGEPVAPGYTVLEHLHRGSVLDTYEVWSDERDCNCVAKLLRADRLDSVKDRRRLLAEGRLLLSLVHPHIVRGYALFRRPQAVVVLEALTGETLSHMLDRRGRLPPYEVVQLGLHLCSAMHYLHTHGFLHLDLKPSNIIADCGQAKVIDLSIARRPGRGHKGAGTHQYLAPEQARGARVEPRTDVWGIGAVLFEAATGHRPFAPDDSGPGYAQLERRAPPVRSLRRLARGPAEAIDAALDPEPQRRPTVRELATLLHA